MIEDIETKTRRGREEQSVSETDRVQSCKQKGDRKREWVYCLFEQSRLLSLCPCRKMECRSRYRFAVNSVVPQATKIDFITQIISCNSPVISSNPYEICCSKVLPYSMQCINDGIINNAHINS